MCEDGSVEMEAVVKNCRNDIGVVATFGCDVEVCERRVEVSDGRGEHRCNCWRRVMASTRSACVILSIWRWTCGIAGDVL